MTAHSSSRTNNHYHTRIPNPNTSLLHPGDQLTYKELVTILDEDFIEPTNSSRKKQLREFQSLFSFTKGPGRKFTIGEIYPCSSVSANPSGETTSNAGEIQKNGGKSASEQQKIQGKTTSCPYPDLLPPDISHPPKNSGVHRGKYYLPFVNILLRYLPYKYGNPMFFIPSHLLVHCGMTNPIYQATNHNAPLKLSSPYNEATASEVGWFYRNTYLRLKTTIDNQMSALVRLDAIEVENSYLLYTTDQGYYPATRQDEKMIKEAEEYALDNLQLGYVRDVIVHNKSKQFYKLVYDELPKAFSGEKYYTCYVIQTKQMCVPMEDDEYHYWRKRMNDLVMESFDKTVLHFYEKYRDQVAEGAEHSKDIHYYSYNFIEKEQELAEQLLRIGKQ